MSLYNWYRVFTERKRFYLEQKCYPDAIILLAWRDANEAFGQ